MLKKNLLDRKIEADVYNLGSWYEKSTAQFGSSNQGFGASCKVKKVVKLEALDNMFFNENITFIKMDVEGAEKESLLGASKIIKKCMPKLAISVYHKSEDIYEILLMIRKFSEKYKIYLHRHNTYSYITEIVCYAIKNK